MKYNLRLLLTVAAVMASPAVRAQERTSQLPKEGADTPGILVAIEFTGNQRISSEELLGFIKYSKLGGPFDLKKFETDLARIRVLLYADRGYCRAQFGEPQITYTDQRIKATVSVKEGLRYRVGNVTVEDATAIPPERIKEILAIRTGDVLRGPAINLGINALRKAYDALGYIQFAADVSPEWKDPITGSDDGVADLTFGMSEGAAFTIGKISLVGNTVTTDEALLRIFAIKPGSACSLESINRGRDRLYKLSIFDEIHPDAAIDNQTRQVDITLRLKPKGVGQ